MRLCVQVTCCQAVDFFSYHGWSTHSGLSALQTLSSLILSTTYEFNPQHQDAEGG